VALTRATEHYLRRMGTPIQPVGEFEAMTGSDWMLLEFEYPDTPMHTLKMVIVDGNSRGRPVSLDEIASVVPRYLDLSPRFTSRAEKHADKRWYWVRRPLQVDRHLDERQLDDPDGLNDLCSQLSQEQLDRSQPLWAITLVHGLAAGRQAIVIRVHHALMDGGTAQRVFARVTTAERGAPAVVPEASTLAGREYRAPLVRRLFDVAAALVDVLRRTRTYGRDPGLVPRGMFRRSQLNLRSSGGRLCAVSELPLADFRELSTLTGTNVNGALHGMISLALRKRMLADGMAPANPLVGSFGVIEDRTLERYAGNSLATARYWLHVEDDDPIRALRHTGESCAESVAFRRHRGFKLQTLGAEFGRFIPPLRNRFVHLWPLTPIHLLTAYVSGPQEQRWLGDVEVVSWISIAVSVELTNVDLVAYTYAGKVAFGLITTPESMPDPAGFLRLCGEALEELLELARSAQRRSEP
jgi:diacylglycerol O-acyltransferase